MIKKLPTYELDQIELAGRCTAAGLMYYIYDVGNPTDGLNFTDKFRTGVDTYLENLHKQWIALYEGNTEELAEWTIRMQFVRTLLDELDRQLIAGRKQPQLFDWDGVLAKIGFIEAFRAAAQNVIDINKAQGSPSLI